MGAIPPAPHRTPVYTFCGCLPPGLVAITRAPYDESRNPHEDKHMPQCILCTKEKSAHWFTQPDGSFKQQCHTCDATQKRFENFVAELQKSPVANFLVQFTSVVTTMTMTKVQVVCKSCVAQSAKCMVCRLIDQYRERETERLKVKTAPPERRLEDITFRPVEKTKIENYTIKCTRCEIRHNPNQVAVVGTVCEFCVMPEEQSWFWKEHRLWNKSMHLVKAM